MGLDGGSRWSRGGGVVAGEARGGRGGRPRSSGRRGLAGGGEARGGGVWQEEERLRATRGSGRQGSAGVKEMCPKGN